MGRIEEIRKRRERAFYKNRMRGNKERQKELDRKLVEDHPELLRIREVEVQRALKKQQEKEDQIEEDEEMEDAMDISEEEEQKVAITIKNKKKRSALKN